MLSQPSLGLPSIGHFLLCSSGCIAVNNVTGAWGKDFLRGIFCHQRINIMASFV
jgi:hypothetical protein